MAKRKRVAYHWSLTDAEPSGPPMLGEVDGSFIVYKDVCLSDYADSIPNIGFAGKPYYRRPRG